MRMFKISLVSALIISIIYHILTYKFKIPFFYTIAIGILLFTLIFFILSETEI